RKETAMSLAEKVVLITGAGTGIGADAARAFARAGSRLVLNGRRECQLRQVADSIDPTGRAVAVVAGDIADQRTSRRMVDVAVERFGGVDVLFNNAGIFAPKGFLEVTAQDLDAYLNLLRGYYFAMQAAIGAMKQRNDGGSAGNGSGNGGAIVNTGSMWANHAIAATPCSASSAAKGGVHALTRNLAIELAKDNIRVNCVAPAVVR